MRELLVPAFLTFLLIAQHRDWQAFFFFSFKEAGKFAAIWSLAVIHVCRYSMKTAWTIPK